MIKKFGHSSVCSSYEVLYYQGFSNLFLQPSFPKPKGVTFNDTCRIVLLKALSILEALFLKLVGTYYIEIDKLRDYQQK